MTQNRDKIKRRITGETVWEIERERIKGKFVKTVIKDGKKTITIWEINKKKKLKNKWRWKG